MISAFLGRTWAYGLMALAAIAAVMGAYFSVRNGGRQAERVDQLKKEALGVRIRVEEEGRAAGLDDDTLDDGLRPPARRRVR